MFNELTQIINAKTGRSSSYEKTGRNQDFWTLAPGQSRVLADLRGPGAITHIWMAQADHYRECLLKITYDNAKYPSVLCPLGDFFGLGHGIVNSYQSFLFSASALRNYRFNDGCALNCYARMPFQERAVIELVNESKQRHKQYFYIDWEQYPDPLTEHTGYFHAEFRRKNPFGGWGYADMINTLDTDIINKGRMAWDNNYVILQTNGRGHYIGCNLSITNLQGMWWGEGDDMIWVDGYKWPPDLHGTGSEDYFNHAWGMQPNAFLRNGSSIFEGNTTQASMMPGKRDWGYQTSYIFHIENPVRFQKEIKVTIEHGHGNHLSNEVSSVAYWYAAKPAKAITVPPVAGRMPVLRDNHGNWLRNTAGRIATRKLKPNREMKAMKAKWRKAHPG